MAINAVYFYGNYKVQVGTIRECIPADAINKAVDAYGNNVADLVLDMTGFQYPLPPVLYAVPKALNGDNPGPDGTWQDA